MITGPGSTLISDHATLSVEPCHPLGFWSRRHERNLCRQAREQDVPLSEFLRASARELIDRSMERSAALVEQTASHMGGGLNICFLLDDLFVSERLLEALPVEPVATMFQDSWRRCAAEMQHTTAALVPAEATVVSEASLTAAAAEMIDETYPQNTPSRVIAHKYQGVEIRVPAHARLHAGLTVPSCPLLAASWQMWRLGRLDDSSREVRVWGARHLPAQRTLTMLGTQLLNVEAAALAILDEAGPPGRHSDHIAYMFRPDHW